MKLPIKGYIKKKEEIKAPDVGKNFVKLSFLIGEVNLLKEEVVTEVDSKMNEVNNKLQEVDSFVDIKKEEVDNFLKETNNTVDEIKQEALSKLSEMKGEPGQNADEEKIIEEVLAKIPIPKIDEIQLTKSILSKIPVIVPLDEDSLFKKFLKRIPINKSKASLKIIQETFQTDPMSVIDKILELPEDKFKLKVSQVDGLKQTLDAFNAQIGRRGYLHGGGDTVVAGTNITVTPNSNGTKTISASGGAPAGTTSDIQFNTGGSFDADTGKFTYDKSTNKLSNLADYGSELAPALTNGNWTLGTGWVFLTSPNRLAVTSATSAFQNATPTAITWVTAFTRYKITFTCVITAGGFGVTIGDNPYQPVVSPQTPKFTTSGTYSVYLTAYTNTKFSFIPYDASSRFEISALSVVAMIADTGDAVIEGTINTNGLNLNAGTIVSPTVQVFTQADTNNMKPGGKPRFLKIASTSSFNVTGLDLNQVDGQEVYVIAVNQPVTLKYQDTGSTASNRFSSPDPSDVYLGAGETAYLRYSGGNVNRWIVLKIGIVDSRWNGNFSQYLSSLIVNTDPLILGGNHAGVYLDNTTTMTSSLGDVLGGGNGTELTVDDVNMYFDFKSHGYNAYFDFQYLQADTTYIWDAGGTVLTTGNTKFYQVITAQNLDGTTITGSAVVDNEQKHIGTTGTIPYALETDDNSVKTEMYSFGFSVNKWSIHISSNTFSGTVTFSLHISDNRGSAYGSIEVTGGQTGWVLVEDLDIPVHNGEVYYIAVVTPVEAAEIKVTGLSMLIYR